MLKEKKSPLNRLILNFRAYLLPLNRFKAMLVPFEDSLLTNLTNLDTSLILLEPQEQRVGKRFECFAFK